MRIGRLRRSTRAPGEASKCRRAEAPEILAWRQVLVKAFQIGGDQVAGHVPAVDGAGVAAADRAGQAELGVAGSMTGRESAVMSSVHQRQGRKCGWQ